MALRITKRNCVLVDEGVSPIYRTMLRSYTRNLKIEYREVPMSGGLADRGQTLDLFELAMKGAVGDTLALARALYRAGADPMVDRAIALNPALEAFLAQDKDEATGLEESFDTLASILNGEAA